MSDDSLYEKNLASYESFFERHNLTVMDNKPGVKMFAIHLHTAIELVDKGVWEAQKEHYFVILS